MSPGRNFSLVALSKNQKYFGELQGIFFEKNFQKIVLNNIYFFMIMIFIIVSMSSNRHKPKRKRLKKAEKQALFQQSAFSTIQDKESLLDFFEKNPNMYHEKVFTLLERQSWLLDPSPEIAEKYDEIHHIIPQSSGGPDDQWNLLPVTFHEHKELHALRYEVYGEEGDRVASMSRNEIRAYTKEQKREAAKRGHETMRNLGIGFYNSEMQREFGRRSFAVGKTPAREAGYVSQARGKNSPYQKLFQSSLQFSFEDENHSLSILAPENTFQRTGQIRDFFLEHTPTTSLFYEKIKQDKYFTSNFNKVLRNLLSFEPGKQPVNTRSKYKGWSVKVGT